MSEEKYCLPSELEIAILSAAYTVYRLQCSDSSVDEVKFREEYNKHGSKFHDLVCGVTNK